MLVNNKSLVKIIEKGLEEFQQKNIKALGAISKGVLERISTKINALITWKTYIRLKKIEKVVF